MSVDLGRGAASCAYAETAGRRLEPWVVLVQQVMDVLPGMSGLLTAERGADGRITDLIWAAASPAAFTADGLRGRQLIGVRAGRPFPSSPSSGRWDVWQRVLDTGAPATIGPFRHGDGVYTVRAHRLGECLLVSWQDVTERENDARRLAEVERLLADEHELAGRLQRIILPIPEEPIELPGVKVALRYLPAGQESLVGGDWYEATALRDGSVLLAVGDVAGHGTQAATSMAQLRHALRALAVTTGDPGVLLGHLNRLTCDLQDEHSELSATAVVARFDSARQELVWAQAGHPPPLLSRGGRTAPLSRPPGPMLGVVDDAAYPTARMPFRVGDVLLLYTDGLVEHRGGVLDDGLAQVIRVVDDAVRACPSQPLGQLLARLRQANPDDDTCILAARPATGETRDLRSFLTGARRPG